MLETKSVTQTPKAEAPKDSPFDPRLVEQFRVETAKPERVAAAAEVGRIQRELMELAVELAGYTHDMNLAIDGNKALMEQRRQALEPLYGQMNDLRNAIEEVKAGGANKEKVQALMARLSELNSEWITEYKTSERRKAEAELLPKNTAAEMDARNSAILAILTEPLAKLGELDEQTKEIQTQLDALRLPADAERQAQLEQELTVLETKYRALDVELSQPIDAAGDNITTMMSGLNTFSAKNAKLLRDLTQAQARLEIYNLIPQSILEQLQRALDEYNKGQADQAAP